MEMIEALKMFDIVFVFIMCAAVSIAAIGYVISECVCSIIDTLKKKYKKKAQKPDKQEV